MKNNNERWVDIGKCVAIFTVITDHLESSLYFGKEIVRVLYFSVPLFVLLMGVTTYWSFDKTNIALWKKVIQRVPRIIMPYVVATFLYHCISYRGFRWIEYRNQLFYFNASGPHYYVLLYIQLIIISPMLFYLIKEIEHIMKGKALLAEGMIGCVCVCVACIANRYTNIAGIYAGKLFGGSYVLCLYLGMLFGKYCNVEIIKWKKTLILTSSLLISCVMAWLLYVKGFVLDDNALLGTITNPPGVTLILYAFSILMIVYYGGSLIAESEYRLLNYVTNVATYIGRQTLYIFLYHRLFLDYFLNKFFADLNILIKIPLYYITMIMGSIFIGYIHKLMIKFILNSYLYKKEQ